MGSLLRVEWVWDEVMVLFFNKINSSLAWHFICTMCNSKVGIWWLSSAKKVFNLGFTAIVESELIFELGGAYGDIVS